MTINKGLLGVGGGLIGALGSQKAMLYSMYSPQCIEAVEKASEASIRLSCPPGFNDFSLITIIATIVGFFILTLFWQDILREVWNRVFG